MHLKPISKSGQTAFGGGIHWKSAARGSGGDRADDPIVIHGFAHELDIKRNGGGTPDLTGDPFHSGMLVSELFPVAGRDCKITVDLRLTRCRYTHRGARGTRVHGPSSSL